MVGAVYASVCQLSHFSRVGLCDPMDCSPPGSSVHGIIQARMLQWVAISYSMGNAEIKPPSSVSPALAGEFFTTEPPGKQC